MCPHGQLDGQLDGGAETFIPPRQLIAEEGSAKSLWPHGSPHAATVIQRSPQTDGCRDGVGPDTAEIISTQAHHATAQG